MAKNYDASNIEVLEGLDAVRLRPGMYIGTTGIKGLHHILWEIVDNAMDEAVNGFAKTVSVTLNEDGSATVSDDGRGIPVDKHPKLGVSGVEVVFTQLHAGGKFNTSNYSYSGGLHGVGASVTNALSRWLKVHVEKDGGIYEMEFVAKEEGGKVHPGTAVAPLKKLPGKTKGHGTTITFMPDERVFEDTVFIFETVSRRLKELAFLTRGVKILLTDKRVKREDGYRTREYCYGGGVVDFVKYLNDAKSVLYNEPIYISGKTEKIAAEIAIQFNDSYTDTVCSYVNNIPTTEGGTHETGFRSALTKAVNDYARKNNILKEKDQNFIGDDLKEGLTAVISVKMNDIEFEGQTKTKLGNPEARPAVESIMAAGIAAFLETKGSKKAFEAIIAKAQGAAKAREAARKAKEIIRQTKSIENTVLVGKLAGCTGRRAELNELFIVEGDSAGGSAKQARDRHFQAILPLRGKPLNAEKKRIDQVLANEEIRTIISALGTGIGEDFELDSLKFHKIIILADADQDGAHIRAILLTFFFRYMKELIINGNVYIGMPPLYKVWKKDFVRYAYDDSELESAIKAVGKGYSIQRYKGLGEMNPEQLWDTTMDPDKRSLMQVTLEDAAEVEKLITTLMGDAIELRKQYIAENANFNKVDTFAKHAKVETKGV